MYMRGSWHVSADDCGVGVVDVDSPSAGADGAVNKPLSGFSAMLQGIAECKKKTRSRDNVFLGFIFSQRTQMQPATIRNVACFF